MLADQCAGNRAANVDQAQLQVGLVFAYDLVAQFFARILIFEVNRRAKDHAAIGMELPRINDACAGEFAFDFFDAPLDKALPVLGSIVFGVFTQVAVRAGFGNRGDDRWTVLRLETLQFGLEFFCTLEGKWNGCHDIFGAPRAAMDIYVQPYKKAKPPGLIPAATGGLCLQTSRFNLPALHAFPVRK